MTTVFVPDRHRILSGPAPVVVKVEQVLPPGPAVVTRWEPPNLARHGGNPRWATVPRPLRVDGSEYLGQEAHTRPVTLMFDGWMQGKVGRPQSDPVAHRSVEQECRVVHLWSRPVGGVGSGGPMPQLRVAYGPWQQQRWWVESVRWADPVLIAGVRVRQEVTLELREAVTVDLSFTPTQQAIDAAVQAYYGRGTGSTPAPSTVGYTVVAGDSLWRIADRQLGDPLRWPEIATLNGISPPYTIRPGDQLKIPAA